MSETTKDQSVETLRGIALILLVGFHAVEEGYPQIYEYFIYSFNYVRMPLFTIISGFIYALRPVNVGSEWVFFLGKVRRVIVPLIAVETLYFVMSNTFRGNWNEFSKMWEIYFFVYEHFWFLQAIFFIFLTYLIIDRFKLIETVEKWFILMVLVVLLSLFLPKSNFLSFVGYLYLLPYFTLGYGFNRFNQQLFTKPIILVMSVAFIVNTVIHQLIWFGYINLFHDKISVISICGGITSTFLLFRYRFTIPSLAILGGYSYTVYLFHGFGISLMGKINNIIGIHNFSYFIDFSLQLCAGIVSGILVHNLAGKYSLTRRLFLGKR
ncbi:MAG: hypothetical protein RIT27_687 [Pseudomonadota bacterium]|jgi:fucose 4-O-acetylase-like acetyltransferase